VEILRDLDYLRHEDSLTGEAHALAAGMVPPPTSSTDMMKWLYVVLNINRILCQCVEKSIAKKQSRQNDRNLNLFSSMVPKIVEPKEDYTRLGLAQFLAKIREVVVGIVI
jgi:hypothetical protein